MSSDHAESTSSNTPYALVIAATFASILVISVNRAGSTPPVAADVTAGASIESTNTLVIDNYVNQYWNGVTFKGTGNNIVIGNSNSKQNYFTNCTIWLNNSGSTSSIRSNSGSKAVFDNTTVRFGAVGQSINTAGATSLELLWVNSPTPIHASGSVPTNMFLSVNPVPHLATFRGVDLSLLTTTLFAPSNLNTSSNKFLLDSCKIASGLTRYGTPTNHAADEVELVNCYDSSNFISERYTPAGAVTTEFTITLSGGAQDNVGVFSHKMVSSSRSDKYAMPLESFWLDVNNASVGSSHTATVEIVSSASLNNDEIWLVIEHQGTVGSSLASFVTTQPATVLTAAAAVTTSTATWNSSPSTPIYQKLVATFTPQVIGRVRAQVRLGKASTTVYYNPQVTIA